MHAASHESVKRGADGHDGVGAACAGGQSKRGRMKRIPFDNLPWQTSASGVRFKVQRLGARQLRLLEFTRELDHQDWCETGHVGFVLEGTMAVAFAEGAAITFHAGDGLCIPPTGSLKSSPTILHVFTSWSREVHGHPSVLGFKMAAMAIGIEGRDRRRADRSLRHRRRPCAHSMARELRVADPR
jgi:hypothetical protein